jgi:SAM-dependent methyltransferase
MASAYQASDGAAYDGFMGRWSRRLAEPFLDFAGFDAEGPLLDVGCGTGSLARAMAARWPGRDVIALDVAAPYLEFAAARPGAAGIAFREGDAQDLSLAHGEVAGTGSLLLLNFVADPLRALAEMRRVTRTGGIVATAGWDFRGGLVYQRLLWDTAAGVDPGAAERRDRIFANPMALPDGMGAAFEAAGLAAVERASLTIRMDFADFDDYWQPMDTGQGPVGSYLADLAPELKARIREAVRRGFLSGAPDGPRSLTATAWAVRSCVR